tara:strand:- start:1007 stop:1987 length:981 start_codon:yes stop_codon:yes gene_type:complete
MIIKNFELNKTKLSGLNFFLFYGENEGLKNEKTKLLINSFKGNLEKFEESEVLNNTDRFISSIINKSFFEDKKIIIISRVSDKILTLIQDLLSREINDTIIVLNSGSLEKKSKLRAFFEKEKQLVCTPFYKDELRTLSQIAINFFKEKKISVSQEIINLIIEKCNGDRKNLSTELDKISSYLLKKEKISLEDVIKLTNLYEDYSVSELADNCLAKNLRKTIKIINENNFSTYDSVLIIRTLLLKTKRILDIKKNQIENSNIDQIISSYKPTIFWKDKEIVKNQVSKWKLTDAENLIEKIYNLELSVKKNYQNSKYIISDFILNTAS